MALRGISKEDIHNITSGQVITDLNNIVKELVENSIDAHSTYISITFKKFGQDGLEVSDNGDGIKEEDFGSLCRKNFTSKLESFEKLVDVKTLGFRGEALNSICNIAQISVSTASASESPRGFELTYSKDGDLIDKKMINQLKGTSIRVSDIFEGLPVRRVYLEKHSRKEFQKCLQTLMSYLLILTNFRFIVYNVDVSGKKKIMMKSTGNSLIKDNVINVYGATGLQGLVEVDKKLELDEAHIVRIRGMLSNSSIGSGRLSRDRQYVYINKRPVEFKKITKLINDVYKRYNYLQYPMVIMNFEIHEHLIDINVTPDKKTILLSNKYEVILMEKLETFLEDFWDNQGTYSIPVNNAYQEKIEERNTGVGQPKLESFALFKDEDLKNLSDGSEAETTARKSIRDSEVIVDINCTTMRNDVVMQDIENTLENEAEKSRKKNEEVSVSSGLALLRESFGPGSSSPSDGLLENDSLEIEENKIKDMLSSSFGTLLPSPADDSIECCDSCHSGDNANLLVMDSVDINLKRNKIPETKINDQVSATTFEDIEEAQYINQKVKLSEEMLISKNLKKRRLWSKTKTTKHSLETSDICDRSLSEKLLGLSVHKNDFSNMEIVGQFNRGFIIVHKQDTDDILIIDQHASDEKYNFEKLIEGTVFENQPLVVPQKLDLNTIERLTILSHLKLFEKNGFKFKTATANVPENIDQGELCEENLKREELYLTSLPYSKNTIFNLKDLNELIQLVENQASSTKTIPRPSKVRSMFAMRACRSSIMIGSSLSRPKMENIVQNLSTLDKPWNCPHGRPTMRHLVKIDQWRSFNEDYRLN